jgi:hypothetical protein
MHRFEMRAGVLFGLNNHAPRHQFARRNQRASAIGGVKFKKLVDVVHVILSDRPNDRPFGMAPHINGLGRELRLQSRHLKRH